MELCVPGTLIGQADLPLAQFLLMQAALGHLPVTHSSEVSAEIPSAPSHADAAWWAPHSPGLLSLGHSLWG